MRCRSCVALAALPVRALFLGCQVFFCLFLFFVFVFLFLFFFLHSCARCSAMSFELSLYRLHERTLYVCASGRPPRKGCLRSCGMCCLTLTVAALAVVFATHAAVVGRAGCLGGPLLGSYLRRRVRGLERRSPGGGRGCAAGAHGVESLLQ